MRPHRWKPTRLPRLWDSPGKNTGVGCHFLLQCMKVKRENQVAQLCLTLSHPMDCSLPDSAIHGIFQARVLEWGAIAFSVIRDEAYPVVYEVLCLSVCPENPVLSICGSQGINLASIGRQSIGLTSKLPFPVQSPH